MNEKLNLIINQLKGLTLLETLELVKEMELIFGIDTSNNFISSTNNINTLEKNIPEIVEEKLAFDISLTEFPAEKKITILKIVRNITGLGLKESKDIVDNIPKILKEGITKEEAELFKKELEAAGAKVIIK